MGDYSTTGIFNVTNGVDFYQISNELSIKGDYSVKIKETTSNVYCGYKVNVDTLIGHVLTFSANILTNSQVNLAIYQHNSVNGDYTSDRVSVTSDNLNNQFSVSTSILENTDYVLCRIDTVSLGTILYMDNWELIAQ